MERLVMIKVELHNRVADVDSAPCFATRTEIELAERLRHQLEKQLLAPSDEPSSSIASPCDAPAEVSGATTPVGTDTACHE
jgi:hypothetical protein